MIGLTVIYVENRQTKKTEAVTVNTIYIKHFSDIMTQGIFVSIIIICVILTLIIKKSTHRGKQTQSDRLSPSAIKIGYTFSNSSIL